MGMLVGTHTKLEPGVGQQTSPKIMEMERQMPSCDSGQNRDSPANSTAAGSLQVCLSATCQTLCVVPYFTYVHVVLGVDMGGYDLAQPVSAISRDIQLSVGQAGV